MFPSGSPRFATTRQLERTTPFSNIRPGGYVARDRTSPSGHACRRHAKCSRISEVTRTGLPHSSAPRTQRPEQPKERRATRKAAIPATQSIIDPHPRLGCTINRSGRAPRPPAVFGNVRLGPPKHLPDQQTHHEGNADPPSCRQSQAQAGCSSPQALPSLDRSDKHVAHAWHPLAGPQVPLGPSPALLTPGPEVRGCRA